MSSVEVDLARGNSVFRVPEHVLAVFRNDPELYHHRVILALSDDTQTMWVLTPGRKLVKTSMTVYDSMLRYNGSRLPTGIASDEMDRDKESDLGKFTGDEISAFSLRANDEREKFDRGAGDPNGVGGAVPLPPHGGAPTRRLTVKAAAPVSAAGARAFFEMQPVTPVAGFSWIALGSLGGEADGEAVGIGDCFSELPEGSWIPKDDAYALAMFPQGMLPMALVRDGGVDARQDQLRGKVAATPRGIEEPKGPTGTIDLRTLPISWESDRKRWKDWKEVCSISIGRTFDDSPHEFASCTLSLCRIFQRNGGSPKAWLERWCRAKNIQETDRLYHEMKCLINILEYGGSIDQLNLPALSCFEEVCRRLQSIIDAMRNPAKPNWNLGKFYEGDGETVDALCTELKQDVTRRAKDEWDMQSTQMRLRDNSFGSTLTDANAADSGSKGKGGGKKGDGKDSKAGRGGGGAAPAAAQ